LISIPSSAPAGTGALHWKNLRMTFEKSFSRSILAT